MTELMTESYLKQCNSLYGKKRILARQHVSPPFKGGVGEVKFNPLYSPFARGISLILDKN